MFYPALPVRQHREGFFIFRLFGSCGIKRTEISCQILDGFTQFLDLEAPLEPLQALQEVFQLGFLRLLTCLDVPENLGNNAVEDIGRVSALHGACQVVAGEFYGTAVKAFLYGQDLLADIVQIHNMHL